MSEHTEMSTLISHRFRSPLQRTFAFRPALLSIACMFLLASSSAYYWNHLSHPVCAQNQIWHRLSTHELDRRKKSNASLGLGFLGNQFRGVDNHMKQGDTCKESMTNSLWKLAPFVAVFLCAMFGIIHELVLVFKGCHLSFQGNDYHFQLTPLITSIQRFRIAIQSSARLTTTIFTTICLTFPLEGHPMLAFGILNAAVFLTFALIPIHYFQTEPWILSIVDASPWIQIAIALNGNLYRSPVSKLILAATGTFQLGGGRFSAGTPWPRIFWDFLSMSSLYLAIEAMCNDNASYFVPMPDSVGLLVVTFIVSPILGLIFVLRESDRTFQATRSMMSNTIWSVFYFLIMRKPILSTMPFKLSSVYKDKPPRKLTLQPYTQKNSKYMRKQLSVLSIAGDQLPETIEVFDSLLRLVRDGFTAMRWVDHYFPQADVNTSLQRKVRMNPWDDGQEYYPTELFSLSPSFPEVGQTVQPTPGPMLENFKKGQLLTYMCQYGIGNSSLRGAVQTNEFPFYRLVNEDESSSGNAGDNSSESFDCDRGLVLDLRALEKYETKPDYEPYGGIAFFRIQPNDVGSNQLNLEWIVVPRTQERTTVNTMSATFRRGESMIVASLYFSVVAGKHLADIHQCYNLVEVGLHNAFDHAMNKEFPRVPLKAHPLRLVLYIHLSTHCMATELTVPHLLDEGGVFTQIFALTHSSLCDYLNNEYESFEYGSDENFEYRESIMGPLMGQNNDFPSFTCSLEWECRYRDIFVRYADAMVNAMYNSDEDVQQDGFLRNFYKFLQRCGKVPARCGEFRTRAGVSRFISDTIFHLTIRHEMYGTSGVTGALDPRVASTQVPKDGGAPGVDEWRSLAYVSLATAHVDFAHLLQDPPSIHAKNQQSLASIFEDATPINDGTQDQLVKRMKHAFHHMQCELRALQQEWSAAVHYEGDENYMFFRPMPKEIHSLAGY